MREGTHLGAPGAVDAVHFVAFKHVLVCGPALDYIRHDWDASSRRMGKNQARASERAAEDCTMKMPTVRRLKAVRCLFLCMCMYVCVCVGIGRCGHLVRMIYMYKTSL